MLKIEFYLYEPIQVGVGKVVLDGDELKRPLIEHKNEVFATSISHQNGVVKIDLANGYTYLYKHFKHNPRIKSILPFNENQTKQFKIV